MLELKKCHLTCCNCHKEFDAPEDLEVETSSEERNMGAQIGYTWVYEDECPKCHNQYGFEINAWEYPIGILDYDELEKNGVEVEYDVDIVQESEDDWNDSWEYAKPSTFEEFNATMQELQDMLKSNLASSSFTFLKMVDAFAVTAMEAYLSGTLINHVKQNEEYLQNAAQKITDLKEEKMSLYEVIKNPNEAKNKVLAKLFEFMYHNIPKIKGIYESVFNIKIDYPLKDLMKIVERRHNIVHRNGKDKDDRDVFLTKEIIENDLDVIISFVKKINDLIDPLANLETELPAGC